MRCQSESPSCRGHPHPPLSNPKFASPMVRSSPVLRPTSQASPAAGLLTDEAPSSQLLSFPEPLPPRHHQEQPIHGEEDHGDDSPNLATEERVGTPTTRFSMLERSPAAGASSGFGFQTPTTTIGTSTSHGLDEDDEMYEEDGNNNRETIDIDDSLDPEEVANATKRFRSQCWKEFVPMVVQGVVMKGRCKHCDELIGAKRGAGTSAMLNHLKRCKKRSRALRIVQDLSSTLRSPGGARLKNWSYDPNASRRAFLRMISLHEFPFAVAEYDGFRSFLETLNPMFNVGCRVTARNGCMRDFKQKKLGLKRFFQSLNCRFSLTADMWTSNQTLGYICVTCHFIDMDWKLQKRIIRFIDVETPHTGAQLFSNILNCIQDWGIEEKICGITLDNASANDTMVGLLKRNLVDKRVLPANGKLLHHRCAGHVINLIVKDGLKLVDPIVVNIRESIKYIRSSQSRNQKFKEIMAQEGLASKKRPGLDVPTRWNSTCLMLKAALEFRKVFESLVEQDPNYKYGPSKEEWDRAALLCKLLEAFNDATNVISASQYPTSNLYFHVLWKIKLVFESQNLEVFPEIEKALKAMKKKFNKYWNKSYITLCIPVVLDPRYKLKFIGFLFNESFPSKSQRRLARVEELFQELFSAYSSQVEDENSSSAQQDGVNLEVVATMNDPWAAWDQQLNSDLQSQVSTELDAYLSENPIPRSSEFDVLKWWMGNSSKYPIIARIAKDVLAIPASSVAAESAFSTGGRIINSFRSNLAPETVEALICLQDWYRAEGSEFSMASIHDVDICEDNRL